MDRGPNISRQDKKWLDGQDVDANDYIEHDTHEILKRRHPVEYVKTQLNILEAVANDLRKQADAFRDQIRSMRRLISEDDF